MRLIMSYLATHPEKLDPVKKQQWAKLARLDAQDMDTVCNMAYLNVAVMKQPGSQVCEESFSGQQERSQARGDAGFTVPRFYARMVCLVVLPVIVCFCLSTTNCTFVLLTAFQTLHPPCALHHHPPTGVQGPVLQLTRTTQEEGNIPQAGGALDF